MKKLITIPLLLISLLLSAETYYVKTGGDDSAAGTADGTAWEHHPWMSTWTGSVTLQPGDIVRMNRGDTWTIAAPGAAYMTVGQSGTSGSYIDTKAYGTGALPVINISTDTNVPVIYADGKNYITFDSIEVTHHSAAFNDGLQHAIQISSSASTPHDWIITNCVLHECPMSGVFQSVNAYNIAIGDTSVTSTATATAYSNHIYNCGYSGIILEGTNAAGLYSNFKIYYNYIHDIDTPGSSAASYGIAVTAQVGSVDFPYYAYIKYNYITNIPKWHGIDSHGSTYTYITDNSIYNCRIGIMAAAIDRVSYPAGVLNYCNIDRNIIEHPAVADLGFDFFGIALTSENAAILTDNVNIRQNTIFFTSRPVAGTQTAAYGIGAGRTEGCLIEDNLIYNGPAGSSNGGILICPGDYTCENVIVRKNYVRDYRYALQLRAPGAVGDIDIYNNILCAKGTTGSETFHVRTGTITGDVTVSNNVIISTVTTVTPYPMSLNLATIGAGASLTVKNNIIGYFGSGAGGTYILAPGTITGTFTCDYNLYWNSTKASAYYSGGAVDWAAWNTAGYDANGFDDTDPLFKGFNMYKRKTDFDLKLTSPAINAGVDVGLTHDIFDFNIIGFPDIGAVESRSFRFYVK